MSETDKIIERQMRGVLDEVLKAFSHLAKMINWLAQRTLTVKEYAEFAEEFNKFSEEHADERISRWDV